MEASMTQTADGLPLPRTSRRRFLQQASAMAMPALAGFPAWSQTQGSSVKLVVGYPPGGITDTIGRLMADKLKDELQRTVIVENRPGAGGRVGAASFKRLPADGEWLMLGTDSLMVHAPLVFRSLPFDVHQDFTPVSLVAEFPYAFATGTEPRVADFAQYVAWIKANPSKAAFGHPAPGSAPHFFGLMLGEKIGVPMTPVPYQGGAPMLAAVAGGQVSAGINALASDMIEMHRSGRTRIVAVTGDKRVPQLTEVPSIVELGYPSVPRGWAALYLPAKAPRVVGERYAAAVTAVLAKPEVTERLASFGLDARGSTPEALSVMMKSDAAAWTPIIEASGFKLDA
jgi:tripartite-type tricarboxylate transporter receptor subunit TctC